MESLRPAHLSATLRRRRQQVAVKLQHMPNILNEEDCSHCIIKYFIVFGFNFVLFIFGGALLAIGLWAYSEKDWPYIYENSLFQIFGGALLAIGLWAYSEKDWPYIYENPSILLQMPDPALACIIIGFGAFILGFFGWMGALRESTCLLGTFSIVLGFLFVAELLLGILAFAFDDWVINFIKEQLKLTLGFYREDPDLQSTIDWVQGDWLYCCGVDSPADWDYNEYFNCTSPSFERCGVPYSCCIIDSRMAINLQCGFGIRDEELYPDGLQRIYVEGCFPQSQAWFFDNMTVIVTIIVGVLVFQLMALIFATSLCADVRRNKRVAKMWTKHLNRNRSSTAAEVVVEEPAPQARDNYVERRIWETSDDEPMEISLETSSSSAAATPRPSSSANNNILAGGGRPADTQVASASSGQLRMAVAQYKRNRIGKSPQMNRHAPSDAIRTVDWGGSRWNQPSAPDTIQLTDVSDVSWITSTYT